MLADGVGDDVNIRRPVVKRIKKEVQDNMYTIPTLVYKGETFIQEIYIYRLLYKL